MTKPLEWARLYDGFWTHPKIIGLTGNARLLYLAALTWSVANLTDGRIPLAALDTIAFHAARITAAKAGRHVRELEAAGLWHPIPEGWVIHNFTDRQTTRDELAAKRAGEAARQARRRRNLDGRYASTNGREEAGPDPPVTRESRVTHGQQPPRDSRVTHTQQPPRDSRVCHTTKVEKENPLTKSLLLSALASAREAAPSQEISNLLTKLNEHLTPPVQEL